MGHISHTATSSRVFSIQESDCINENYKSEIIAYITTMLSAIALVYLLMISGQSLSKVVGLVMIKAGSPAGDCSEGLPHGGVRGSNSAVNSMLYASINMKI